MSNLEKPRLSRLTSIVTQLQSKSCTTATFLADKYGVSVRTIYRDIRTLEQSGIPIITEEGKGYALMKGYQLPPVMFTEGEANALVTVEKLIGNSKDQSLIENYKDAVSKIRAVLKHSQKKEIDFLSERVWFRKNQKESTTSNYLMTIQSCITKFVVLEIEYLSLQNQRTKRQVEPFALISTQGNWLLIAFCRLRKEFRVFRIDHIQKLEVKEESFEPHDMTIESYFKSCREKEKYTPDIPLSYH